MLTESELRESIRRQLRETADRTHTLLERKRKKRKEPLEPPITDLTKTYIEDESKYKSDIQNALKRFGGHIPLAADSLGVSTRTLQRHIDRNFGYGELDELLAGPGPDLEWDLDTGKRNTDLEYDRRTADEKRRQRRSRERERDFERRSRERDRKRSAQ